MTSFNAGGSAGHAHRASTGGVPSGLGIPNWRDHRVEHHTPRMSAPIVMTAAGDVELEERGSGTPVLVVHGSPGGIDAARAMGRFLPEDRFRVIALSRPGYLCSRGRAAGRPRTASRCAIPSGSHR